MRLLRMDPARVALLGTVVVALLLLVPIPVRAPGDHESMSCGNALTLDLGPASRYPDEYTEWERAYQSCTSARISRVAEAVGVTSVTVLVAALVGARARRRIPDEPPPRPSYPLDHVPPGEP